mmetsp:Transcript_131474/g.228538  ORF Transcript_131474/g.228538 Transcript_131474/m.228538 type:complete len:133 (+) Transcript_131474:117-515(+)
MMTYREMLLCGSSSSIDAIPIFLCPWIIDCTALSPPPRPTPTCVLTMVDFEFLSLHQELATLLLSPKCDSACAPFWAAEKAGLVISNAATFAIPLPPAIFAINCQGITSFLGLSKTTSRIITSARTAKCGGR